MRQNQYQVNDRTHTTNTPRQDTHGQHWMSARAMSAHFFTSLHPCLTQSGTYDGVESRGWSDTHSHCSAQFTTLITPNISIERPDAHLADGPTQDVAMANHRPYLRALTHVFHYVRCFIYTRNTQRPPFPRFALLERKRNGNNSRVACWNGSGTGNNRGRAPAGNKEETKREQRNGATPAGSHQPPLATSHQRGRAGRRAARLVFC